MCDPWWWERIPYPGCTGRRAVRSDWESKRDCSEWSTLRLWESSASETRANERESSRRETYDFLVNDAWLLTDVTAGRREQRQKQRRRWPASMEEIHAA